MKMSQPPDDLEPWLSEGSSASPELRGFLREATGCPNDAERIERLRQRLGPWLVIPPSPSPPSPSPPATVEPISATFSLSAAGKACLVAVGVSALTAGVWSSGGSGQTVSAAASTPPSIISVAPPTRAVSAAPEPALAAPTSPTAKAAARRAPPPPTLLAPVEKSSLAQEAAELGAAQRALATSPRLALARLQEHQRKYPHGALAEERRLFTIQALLSLGRRADAVRELEALRGSAPRSPHLVRAQKLIEMDATGR
jgi:hypothetical protein